MSKPLIFWFRRDLRLDDNAGLYHALKAGYPVRCLFVFDTDILDHLDASDRRIDFIWQSVSALRQDLQDAGSDLHVAHGSAETVLPMLARQWNACAVFANRDYEPQATLRDTRVAQALEQQGCSLQLFKDQVIFETDEYSPPRTARTRCSHLTRTPG